MLFDNETSYDINLPENTLLLCSNSSSMSIFFIVMFGVVRLMEYRYLAILCDLVAVVHGYPND